MHELFAVLLQVYTALSSALLRFTCDRYINNNKSNESRALRNEREQQQQQQQQHCAILLAHLHNGKLFWALNRFELVFG